MKWITAFILLIGIGFTSAETFPIIVDGGEVGGATILLLPRNPFFEYYTSFTAAPNVRIDFPEDGETYYNNTLYLNATVSGGSPPYTCWYRTSGDWNNYNCESQTVTFPSGATPVTVLAMDNHGQMGYDTININIEYWFPGGTINEELPTMILGGSLSIMFILLAGEQKRKKRQTY